MSFLNPAAFLFLLGIPAVIILHLLKIRRRQAVVSSTLLWADSLRDQQATAPFRRLKPSLLLLLQALIILLLALALARPVRTVQVSGYERTVFILDVSASMQARDIRGSRFVAAKEALSAAVARLEARTSWSARVSASAVPPRRCSLPVWSAARGSRSASRPC